MGDCIRARRTVGSTKLIAMGLMESVVALAMVVAKQTSRASKKLMRKVSSRRRTNWGATRGCTRERGYGDGDGNGAVWQRSIMMGDRCQPLNFSGVIYYDCDGNRVTDPPVRSPRASPVARRCARGGV